MLYVSHDVDNYIYHYLNCSFNAKQDLEQCWQIWSRLKFDRFYAFKRLVTQSLFSLVSGTISIRTEISYAQYVTESSEH